MFIYFNRSNRGHGTSRHSLITHPASEQCHLLSIVGRPFFQIYNVQNLKITRITTFRICNLVYQAGSRWDPKGVFNFLRFFERTLYKSNYIIFILSCCRTHTKIRSKLVDIVTAGSQKITLWGPQRTPPCYIKGLTWRFCEIFSNIFSNELLSLYFLDDVGRWHTQHHQNILSWLYFS